MDARAKPTEYGHWWNNNSENEGFYQKIFALRERAHLCFLDWYSDLVRKGEPTKSILEVGCGRAYPYGKIFRELDYNGTDISEKEIAFCKQRYGQTKFFVSDIIQHTPTTSYDVVFSHAVIDHVYDMNAFLTKLAQLSRGWFYVSAYLGWFPSLSGHLYEWRPEVTCYHNRLSPDEARRNLEASGSREVQIFPVYIGNKFDNIDLETVILGRGTAGR
jgi:SAM-dependent methyltransferase